MNSKKLDLKKELKQYYNPKPVPEFVEVPSMKFLMIDGIGNVSSEFFKNAIECLFSVSYKTKFLAKSQLNFDYTVMPLEGLWWADDLNDFITGNKDHWRWTLMIMQPDLIDANHINEAIKATKQIKELKALDSLRFESFKEGKSVQMIHIGPFSEEHANILKMHQLIEEIGGNFDGKILKHHEIYLSDFRKVDPKKMRTILRQPYTI